MTRGEMQLDNILVESKEKRKHLATDIYNTNGLHDSH